MARPLKTGLEYFPHDVDASSDEKLVAMRAMHGNDGYAFFFTLLERIYRTEKGALNLSKPVWKAAVVSILNITRDNFEAMMCTAIDVGLFDGNEYAKGIVTSNGIRDRMDDVVARRERWRARRADFIKNNISRDNHGDNPTDNKAVTPQSKAYKKAYKKENLTCTKAKVSDDTFILFWDSYPKKTDKGAALKAWNTRLKEGALPENIISGAKRYARHVEDGDPKYIKNPATFLNAIAYENEYEIRHEEKNHGYENWSGTGRDRDAAD